jgi:hypothetical protein
MTEPNPDTCVWQRSETTRLVSSEYTIPTGATYLTVREFRPAASDPNYWIPSPGHNISVLWLDAEAFITTLATWLADQQRKEVKPDSRAPEDGSRLGLRGVKRPFSLGIKPDLAVRWLLQLRLVGLGGVLDVEV